MDGINALAQILKNRENTPYMGPQIGSVLTPPPNIQVKLGEKIILTKKNLVIAAHVVIGYKREVSISQEDINGMMVYEDTLKEGDQVILIPSINEQLYFLMDKAVIL